MILTIRKEETAAATIALVEFGPTAASTQACRNYVDIHKKSGIEIDWYYFDSAIGTDGLLFEIKNLIPFYDTVVLYKRQNIFKIIDPEKLAYMPL